jgi:putative flippase GtrA
MEGRIPGNILHSKIQHISLKGPVIMIKKTSIQLIKYIGVGGTAALIEWTGFAILIGPARFHYLVAVTVSFITATAINYILSARFVFVRGRHPAHKELMLLYLVSAIGLVMNLLLMTFFVGLLKFSAMPAKIASTGIVFIWNFSSRKIWVFEK